MIKKQILIGFKSVPEVVKKVYASLLDIKLREMNLFICLLLNDFKLV